MAMELPRIAEEQNAYNNVILASEHGKGVAFSGKFYHLCYGRYTPNSQTLKCEGISLVIKSNIDQSPGKPIIVKFEPEKIGVLDSLNGKVAKPFKVRLKEATDKQIAVIEEFDDHNRKVKETAEKIVQCHMNIDNLMTEITSGTAISHITMIEDQANAQKALKAAEEKVEAESERFMSESTSLQPQDFLPDQSNNRSVGAEAIDDLQAKSRRANDIILNADYRVIESGYGAHAKVPIGSATTPRPRSIIEY
jgi:hypothetical protein